MRILFYTFSRGLFFGLLTLLGVMATPADTLAQHLAIDPRQKTAKPEGPELTIRGNGFPIENGDTIPKLEDNTDFGPTEVFGEIPKHRFIINNTGDEILQMRNPETVQLKGTDTLTFRVIEQPQSRLGPGDQTAFKIQFDPDTQKVQRATVEIRSNDSSRTPFRFRIRGQGTPYTSVGESPKQSPLQTWQAGQELRVSVPQHFAKMGRIRLIGLRGITYWQANLPPGKGTFSIPTNGLKAGVYIVAIHGPEQPHFQKVIIR